MTHSILSSFLQAGPTEVRWASAGLAIVLSAIWSAFTGVLAVVMVTLFAVDVGLGVLKALHQGGLRAFDRDRFGRALIKLGAAMLGVLLAASIDLVLQHAGTVEGTPLATGMLAFMCWGFAWSGVQNLSYFFPGVAERIDGILRRSGDVARRPKESS